MGKQVRKQKKSSMVAGSFFRLAFYVCVAVGVTYVGKSAYDFGYAIFNQEPVASEEDGRDITVVLKKGDSVYQIGKILEKKGLIDNAKIFVVQEMLSSNKDKMQPGTYILNTNMTADEQIAILAKENTEGQPDQTDTNGAVKAGNSEIQNGSDNTSSESEKPQDEGGEES